MTRTRTLAVTVAVTALALFAYQNRAALPSVPDPTTLIVNARNQVQPFHYTLSTEPRDPACDEPVTLVVHAVDANGQPVDGLTIEATATIAGSNHEAPEVKLRGRGHGSYEGKVSLELAGSWDVDLVGEKDSKRARQRLSLEIGPPRPPHHVEDDDDNS